MSKIYGLPYTNLTLREEMTFYSDKPILTPDDGVCLLADYMRNLAREVMCVICMDYDARPICIGLAAMGDTVSCSVAMVPIVQLAVLSGAGMVMFVHNHPTREPWGKDLTASKQDMVTTAKLVRACAFFDIPVYDSVVVNGMVQDGEWRTGVYSMRKKKKKILKYRISFRDLKKAVHLRMKAEDIIEWEDVQTPRNKMWGITQETENALQSREISFLVARNPEELRVICREHLPDLELH